MSRRTMSLAAFLVVLADMSTFFAFTRSAGKLVRVRNALVPETIQEIEKPRITPEIPPSSEIRKAKQGGVFRRRPLGTLPA